jgi:hypothetical protein
MFNLFARAGASSLVYAFLCVTEREMKDPNYFDYSIFWKIFYLWIRIHRFL